MWSIWAVFVLGPAHCRCHCPNHPSKVAKGVPGCNLLSGVRLDQHLLEQRGWRNQTLTRTQKRSQTLARTAIAKGWAWEQRTHCWSLQMFFLLDSCARCTSTCCSVHSDAKDMFPWSLRTHRHHAWWQRTSWRHGTYQNRALSSSRAAESPRVKLATFTLQLRQVHRAQSQHPCCSNGLRDQGCTHASLRPPHTSQDVPLAQAKGRTQECMPLPARLSISRSERPPKSND